MPLKEKKPYLGICLGAQMLAKQLGARVYKHPDGHAEVGYYPIRPTAAGRERLHATGPITSINGTAKASICRTRRCMLAEGDSFPVQAFSYGGTAYALQFHMDVTHATMCRWTTRGHERMTLPNAKPREAHFEGRLMHDPACRAWLDEFIDHWLEAGEAPRGRDRQPPAASAPRRVEGLDPVELARTPSARSATTISAPMPPTSTAGMVPSQAAIRPARKSPSWLDAMTNSEFTALTRPRMSSGVSSWISVMRMTTLIMSAAPSTASSAIDRMNERDSAKTMIAMP